MAHGGSSSNSKSKETKEPKISALVVEDYEAISKIHERILKRYNMETKVVENGTEAVDLYRLGERFDVVFMDNNMPKMNGIEATKKLRAMGVKSMIVGVTSDTGPERVQFLAAGLDKCFEKPLNNEMVEEILQKLKK